MIMDFSLKYAEYKKIIETYFFDNFKSKLSQSRLDNAVSYSFFGEGKRFRPVLAVAVADYLSVDLNKVLPFALSIECVHAHSLVHDDLPALDNADIRRNAPSCHIHFDESTAVLAGDALLNFAYSFLLDAKNSFYSRDAFSFFSERVSDMLRGQAYDTAYSKGIYSSHSFSQNEVLSIYKLKTSALIKASVCIPVFLAEQSKILDDFSTFSDNLGLLFQITDDLIDYKDFSFEDANRCKELNFVSLFGAEKSLKTKLELVYKCNKICDKYSDFSFLKSLVDFVAERNV